eukprot:CAMPEP_0195307178 /NCGR_PEP_ID=MMETSP0707-20130614/37504_1 /TAXON_ID=33640 /ORGANISM="Asterionellopsis glacialis, Strain CCMP134" /LENGTH=267 /DNA_ID=CAMNT_0040371425 /DNA_START=33 /DNA_END=835 /DNA_ORIENTATION=+
MTIASTTTTTTISPNTGHVEEEDDGFDVFGDYSDDEDDHVDNDHHTASSSSSTTTTTRRTTTRQSQATLDALASLSLQQKAKKDAALQKEQEPKKWKMIDSKEVDGGKGLESTVDIAQGVEIHREPPLLKCPNGHLASSQTEAIEKHKAYVQKKFDQCTPAQQQSLLELYTWDKYNDSDGNPTIYGYYQTNSVKLTGKDATEGGVFPIMCRMNHSCTPNIQHLWHEDVGELSLFALRDIEQGEELYVTYGQFHNFETTQQRRGPFAK